MAKTTSAIDRTATLGRTYQQLNSATGRFATNTLIADRKALASGGSSNDSVFQHEQARLRRLADARDALATSIKAMLRHADAEHAPIRHAVRVAIREARALIDRSALLRASIG